MQFHLECIECKEKYKKAPLYKCLRCHGKGILLVRYEFDHEIYRSDITLSELKRNFIFHDHKIDNILGEGNTPVKKFNTLSEKLNINLYGKYEFLNPTGSFKDRPVAAGIKKAIDFGIENVVVASSGNGAAAVSAYAAATGLNSIVLVPESIPLEKVMQTKFYGSKVIKIKGPYSNSFNLALKMSQTGEFYNLTTTFINPYTIEGDKGVAFELHFQLDEWPDYIVVPIGAGPLLAGIYKGFEELNKLFGLKRKLPKMIGVQASGCSPIARAFLYNAKHVTAEKNPSTIAGGISDGLSGYSEDGTYTLDIIRNADGYCIDVSDEEILEAQLELARMEGIFVEPSAASSLAGIYKLSKLYGEIFTEKNIALILTGNGLKDLKSIRISEQTTPCINPEIEELNKALETF